MAWDEERAKDRVKKNDYKDHDFDIKDLKRSMDFNNLGPRDVRRAQGVHMYVDMPGFHDAVQDAGNDQQKQRKLVRAASVLRKVQGDLLDDDDIGDIQRQTVRLHALAYKPYDTEKTSSSAHRAERAVKHAITHNTYVHDVFAEVFDDANFDCAAGLACGTSYIANIGKTGNRELISLGSCANLAAKMLGGGDTITVSKAIYDELPACLQEVFKKDRVVAGMQTYVATGVRWSSHPELAQELEVKWDADKWKEKTEAYRDDLPLSEIQISEATVRINVEDLSERNCKRTDAVAIYADLDGFTKYVQEAENNDKVVSLIRMFHMIRAELHAVITSDFEGVVMQHRGDCVLAISHLPPGAGESGPRCDDAVDIAIGLQSSMKHALNEHLSGYKDIHVAIGMNIGKTFVTRLGKKGQRISICFGPKVSSAETLQRATGPKRIRIADWVYDELSDEDVKDAFERDGDTYVAHDLTFPSLDEKKETKAANAGRLGAAVRDGKVVISTSAGAGKGVWHDSKPWSNGNRGVVG
jgi:class 3 adenylate cyclase